MVTVVLVAIATDNAIATPSKSSVQQYMSYIVLDSSPVLTYETNDLSYKKKTPVLAAVLMSLVESRGRP